MLNPYEQERARLIGEFDRFKDTVVCTQSHPLLVDGIVREHLVPAKKYCGECGGAACGWHVIEHGPDCRRLARIPNVDVHPEPRDWPPRDRPDGSEC